MILDTPGSNFIDLLADSRVSEYLYANDMGARAMYPIFLMDLYLQTDPSQNRTDQINPFQCNQGFDGWFDYRLG